MSMTKRENALGVARWEELQSNSPDEHDESRGGKREVLVCL